MSSSRSKFHNKSGKSKVTKQQSSLPRENTQLKANKITEPISSSSTSERNEPKQSESEVESQFILELCWCIQQLENSLKSGKLNQKQVLDAEKSLKILKSSNQPIVRKRQVMHMSFGNYKLKMAEEEKKMSLDSKKIQFTDDEKNVKGKKSCFIKKCRLLANHRNENSFLACEIQQLKIDNCVVAQNQKDEKTENITVENLSNQIASIKSHDTDGKENTFRFNFNIENEKN